MKHNTKFSQTDSLPQSAASMHASESVIQETPSNYRKKINKKTLINQLNYVNFNDGTILIKMRHKKYDDKISLEAGPLPCTLNTLTCNWVQAPDLIQKLQSYRFNHFLLSDGLKLIRVDATVQESDQERIVLELPDFSYELSSRKVRRQSCHNIDVVFIQNGAVFTGKLIDYSSHAFKVEISTDPPQTFQWIQDKQPVSIILKDNYRTYYSGETNIIRYTREQCKRYYVLEPVKKKITRFKKKKFRSVRHILNPSPNIIFTHPFTKKTVILPVYDISGSGFSVEEDAEEGVLLPGLVLPDLEIEIANQYSLKCLSQAIYSNKNEHAEKNGLKCGLAILDMDLQEQMMLSGVLQRSNNKKTYMCNKVSLDNLWSFFFKSGFIYPQKYHELYYNKEKFKKIYEKLYVEHPQIARHFIFQDKGIIHGHMSMLRYFTNTWLVHHHASDSATFRGPGITVLHKACQFINDFCQQYSTHLRYIVCYYRTNNRFPNRIFGKFTHELNEPSICSIYPMAYMSYTKETHIELDLPKGLQVDHVKYEDLLELKNSIGKKDGNLIFHALDFEQELFDTDTVSAEYEKIGFKRKKVLYSIKYNGHLKAIALILISETGINLSNLTNCIYFFIVDSHDFEKGFFYRILNKLQNFHHDMNIPVLIYPYTYAEDHGIKCEKIYNFWVYDSEYFDSFLEFIDKFVK